MATQQFKDTNFGRAVRTFNQVLITVIPLVLGILALPELEAFLKEYLPAVLVALPVIVAVVTQIYNFLQNRYGKSG